jgi:protein-L-isoaspartate(D-aspartate) O-methyltransferase
LTTVKYRPFGGFPCWLLGNRSISNFMEWLKNYNRRYLYRRNAVGFYGLDLYNLYGSIDAVINYLQDVDPAMALLARRHYDCLMPWVDDPPLYSGYMEDKQHRGCEDAVNAVLAELHQRRHWYRQAGRERYFDAVQNARLIRNGEFYFRTRYQDVVNSWNLRDNNMLDTLLAIMRHRGPAARAVVWAHNTHIGDARATDMHDAGEINLGQRARETFGHQAYLIGFGTDHGTVTAASRWGGPAETIRVPPSHKDSYGHIFHQVKARNFILPLRYPLHPAVRNRLMKPRLQRGIGSTYTPDPDKEIKHHYAYASLPFQFDEYIWIDETRAVEPLGQ